jgi:hypothetical protein
MPHKTDGWPHPCRLEGRRYTPAPAHAEVLLGTLRSGFARHLVEGAR